MVGNTVLLQIQKFESPISYPIQLMKSFGTHISYLVQLSSIGGQKCCQADVQSIMLAVYKQNIC